MNKREEEKALFFSKLAEENNGEYTCSESTWFNGRAYMPLNKHKVRFIYRDWKIFITYENRESEYSKPSGVNSGANADRHLYSINCFTEIMKGKRFKVFFDYTFFSKLCNQNKKGFSVKSRNVGIKSWLNENEKIIEIYSEAKKRSEFEPEIFGLTEKGKYSVQINYMTQSMDLKTIELFDSLIKEILIFLKSKK
jgi:hypothetical protein